MLKVESLTVDGAKASNLAYHEAIVDFLSPDSRWKCRLTLIRQQPRCSTSFQIHHSLSSITGRFSVSLNNMQQIWSSTSAVLSTWHFSTILCGKSATDTFNTRFREPLLSIKRSVHFGWTECDVTAKCYTFRHSNVTRVWIYMYLTQLCHTGLQKHVPNTPVSHRSAYTCTQHINVTQVCIHKYLTQLCHKGLHTYVRT